METKPQLIQNMKLASEIFEEHGGRIRTAIGFYVNDKSSVDDVFQDHKSHQNPDNQCTHSQQKYRINKCRFYPRADRCLIFQLDA